MGNFVQAFLFHNRVEKNHGSEYTDPKKIPMNFIEDDKETTLGTLMKGKKLTIVVIVSSKCAFSDKFYTEFVNIYDEYKDYGL